MKNKISFLAVLAVALNMNYVCASECVDDDCEITPVEVTEEIESVDTLIPLLYEYDWATDTPVNIEATEEMCEHDYNCPFATPEECAVWYKKPAYNTTVAPRAPHLTAFRTDDVVYEIYSNDEVDASAPGMHPLMQRYTMLMNAGDACCTSGIIHKMREKGASDKDVYEFLKDDANYFGVTKRCLVMTDEEIESRYSNGVTGDMVAEVRNLCLCKNQQWFGTLLQPFDDIYALVPDFAESPFMYSYVDSMGREINVSVNEDVQKAMGILSVCPK